MVAIVTGNGLGLERSSGLVLGSNGQLGSSAFGSYGENVTVNAATGNLVIGRTDEILIGQGLDSDISRAYNSLASYSGLGTSDNWQLNDERHVTGLTGTVNAAGSTITLIDWDGSNVVYTYDSTSGNPTSGKYVSTEGVGAYNTLSFSSSTNLWTWTDGSTQATDTFDNANGGRIAQSADTNGNTLTYSYTGSQLTRVAMTDASGTTAEHTDLTWSGSNLTQITTTLADGSMLTRTRYTYDVQNRLSTVITDLSPTDNSITDGNTVVTTYTYVGNTAGVPSFGQIASISQTGGATLNITYDSGNRVSTIAQTMATGVTNTTTLSYGTGTTSITDTNGQTTTLSYDANDQLTGITLPPAETGATAETQSFTYDSNGNVLTATDGSGNVTTYQYDSNGNVTLVRDQAGNTVTRTYDSANHLLTQTAYTVPDPDGAGSGQPSNPETTRYAYDSNGNLRFVVNPLGDVTEYRYNGAGEQTSKLVYLDGPQDGRLTYNISGLGVSDPIALSDLENWATSLNGNLYGVDRTDTTYDFRGNISTVTTYSSTNGGGTGDTTKPYTVVSYTYDQYGNLLTRQTSGIADSEVFGYDGLGRMTSSVDLNGGATSIAYNNSTNTVVTTLANGLVKTSVYNLAGELVSSTQSGSGLTTATTSYAYDALGRLRMVTDAMGNNTYYLYDNDGRKVADIAADGAITEYRYDQSNRLVSTINYATKLTNVQLASLVSGGAPTNVQLASIRPTSSPSDVWNWRIYDTANRLVETIDGVGDVVVYAYDGASNLVSTTAYANALSSSTVAGFRITAPTSLQLPTADGVRDAVTRNFYNSDNQLIGTLNADGYLTTYSYNEAGQKIGSMAHYNITAAADRASGSFATLLADVGSSAMDEGTYVDYSEGVPFIVGAWGGSERAGVYQEVDSTIDQAGHIVEQSATNQSASPSTSYNGGRGNYTVYDNAGRVAYTIDANGGVIGYSYNVMGEVVKTTAYATLDTAYAMQDFQPSPPSFATMNSWAASNAQPNNDRVTRTFYDLAGQLVYTVDAEGYVTQNQYDLDGHVTRTIRYPSSYTVTDSTTTASLASITGSIPSTAVQTAYSYDADGRLTDSTDGNGVITHTSYDALGRVTDQTVAYGLSDAATTHYVYDAAGRLSSETDAYGTAEASTTSYTYNGQGQILTKTDGRGYVTSYTYDNLGQVLTATTPIDASNSATVTNVYDAFGNVIQSTDANGNSTYFYYDGLNRLVFQIDGAGYVTQTNYGFGSEITSVIHYATPVTGSVTIDQLWALSPTGSHDEVTSFTRDNLGRVTQMTDAEGHTEQYVLDAFGDQVQVTNQLGGVTTNTFDRRGLLTSETMAENSVRSDGSIEATSVTNKYTYDARGNLTQKIEAYGLSEARTTSYTYDKMNRLLTTTGDTLAATIVPSIGGFTATWGVVPVTTNTYDDRGNLIETVDPTGAKTFTYYDHLNRKIATVNAVGTLSTFSFDANGNVTSQRVYGDAVLLPSSPGGFAPSPVNGSNYRETDYTYDRANRLLTTTVTGITYGYYNGSSFVTGTTNLVVTNTYDKDGNLTSQTDANGNTVYYYYDKRGDKIAQVDQDHYLTYYTLDADGNVLKQESFAVALSSAPTTSSDPTALRAGVAGNANDRITTFTYDRNGHRLTETRQNVTYYTVNSGGFLSSATGNVTVSYTYNGLGEVTSKTEATGDATNYTYDSFGRQTNITKPGFTDYTGASVAPTTAMYYDGLNDLTRTVVNSTLITTNTYGPSGVLQSSTDASGFTTNFWYDAAGRLTTEAYVLARSDGSTVEYGKFTQYDALGRAISQQAGTYNGSNWVYNDYTQTQYNTYGEVAATGENGLWQVTNSYDNAGRLWKTDAGNGVIQIYYYDQNGNQTAEVTSDGNALPSGYSWSSLTQSQVTNLETNGGSSAFGTVAVSGMVMTFKTYDARGQNTSLVEPLRQTTLAGTTSTITKQQTYDAFGDVTSSTDARGYVTNYTYNAVGKLVQTQNPTVNVTDESGNTTASHPLQTNYYDQSGRLVAVQDANGNITSQILLAGTGYDGANTSILKQFNPDSSVLSYGYDVSGNQRTSTDGDGNVTQMAYDAMGRLVQVTHPTRAAGTAGNTTGSAQTLIDYYVYDGLGERITHWNNEYGSTVKDRTDYDSEGRVVQTVDMAGHTTTTSYSWSSSINTALAGGGSLGAFGGFVETTSKLDSPGASAYVTSSVTVDYFNRNISKTDFGGNTNGFSYNLAGQLANETVSPTENIQYLYYNTGALKSIDDITNTYSAGTPGYYYDNAGSTTHTVYSTYTNPVNNGGTAIVTGYDSYGNAIVSGYYNSAYEYYYAIEQETVGVTDYYTSEVDTYTTVDRHTSFEYDVDGNRTYEGATLTTTNTYATYYNDHNVTGTTYYFYSDDVGSGVTRHAHTYSYQVPEYGAYTYYTTDFVSDAYTYTDSSGNTIYIWPVTGYETVENPTTYYTAYYWHEDGSTSYDSCYGSQTYYDYGYGEYVPYQVANPPTYSVVPYTYNEMSYSDPHFGHYVQTPHTGYEVTGYYTAYGTSYTDDGYSFNNPTYSTNPSTTTTDYHTYSVSSPVSSTVTLENESVTYDAMNRVTSIHDDGYHTGSTPTAPTTITMKYDANGNVRERYATYRALDANGNPSGTDSIQDYWYKYDSMNRFVTTMGTLSGGVISRGTTGFDLTYDLAGNRHSQTDTTSTGDVHVESYTYTADGFLAEVDLTDIPTSGSTTSYKEADYALDQMGRATVYKEYGAPSGGTQPVLYERDATYDNIGEVTADAVTRVMGSTSTYTQGTYTYTDGNGHWLGGVMVHSHTTASGSGGVTEPATDTVNSYVWRDSAILSSTSYQANAEQTVTIPGYWDPSGFNCWIPAQTVTEGNTTAWVTNYRYDVEGNLIEADINDGQPRTITFVNNQMGEVVKRDVTYAGGSTTGPHELHYYLEGTAIGDVTNNGTSKTDYAMSIAAQTASNSGSAFNPTAGYVTPNGYGPFAGGSNTASPYADFDQSYNPINGFDAENEATTYSVRTGDTLSSIALALWGDASLWYLIAQANGISATTQLQPGQSLIIPNNEVHNFHNNSSTVSVYNPSQAIGDTSPTAPELPAPPPPPAPPAHNGGGCGIFGTILLAVVAVAVAAVTYGALSGPASEFAASSLGFDAGSVAGTVAAGSDAAIAGGVLAGAAGGIAGEVVSQGLGLATGQQSAFNWTGLALGAIGGAVGGGLSAAKAFSGLEEIGGAVARGVAGSVVTEGIGVATGLQSHFDWAGVAAAGVGAGVGAYAGQQIQLAGGFGFSDAETEMVAEHAVSGMASDVANAATRTLTNGSDFGDNLMSALPDTIGQTIGNMFAGTFSGGGQRLVQAPNIQAPALDLSGISMPYVNDDGTVSNIPYTGNGIETVVVTPQSGATDSTGDAVEVSSAESIDRGNHPYPVDPVDMGDATSWQLKARKAAYEDFVAQSGETYTDNDINEKTFDDLIAKAEAREAPGVAAAEANEMDMARLTLVPFDAAVGGYKIATGNGRLGDYLAVAGVLPVGKMLGMAGKAAAAESAAARAARLGREGEAAAGITGPKVGITINGRMRFPDEISPTTIKEVKNVAAQGWTSQLKDYAQFAKDQGKTFELWVRQNTQLSGPLRAAELRGDVTIVRKLPRQ